MPNFNTSHINVNRQSERQEVTVSLISIHLMLMLIKNLIGVMRNEINISIHLMLMLISAQLYFLHLYLKISIHLMLMLIYKCEASRAWWNVFQYISC